MPNAVFKSYSHAITTRELLSAMMGSSWDFGSIKPVELRGNWESSKEKGCYERVSFLPLVWFRQHGETAYYFYGCLTRSVDPNLKDGTPILFQFHPYLETGELRICEEIKFEELKKWVKHFASG